MPGKKNEPRLMLFDLETTNLNANFGYILCFGYKLIGQDKTTVISISDFPEFQKDPTNDYYLVKKAGEILSSADMWITWYGAKFDVPYMNTRLLFHGLPVLPFLPHVDGWKIARFRMRLNSNRLASVTGFFGFEEKTALNGPIWIRASAGHKPSIKYVAAHCKQDVLVLEQVYEKIKILHRYHPNIALMNNTKFGCFTCGSTRVQKRGVQHSRSCSRQRYSCTDCGSWSSGGPMLSRTELS